MPSNKLLCEVSMDRIYTIDEYYDGPVSGVADANGQPHYYECIFDEDSDEYSKNYRLSPISERAFELIQQQWEIWLRWNEAFIAGKVEANTHPALPEDEARYNEIEQLTYSEKSISHENHLVKRAQFIVPKEPGLASIWYVIWSSEIT